MSRHFRCPSHHNVVSFSRASRLRFLSRHIAEMLLPKCPIFLRVACLAEDYADYLFNCRLFVRLLTICAIADYLRDCRFLDQDFCMFGGFLEDSWIICTIADNLYIRGLFARWRFICAIVDYSHNFTDYLRG